MEWSRARRVGEMIYDWGILALEDLPLFTWVYSRFDGKDWLWLTGRDGRLQPWRADLILASDRLDDAVVLMNADGRATHVYRRLESYEAQP